MTRVEKSWLAHVPRDCTNISGAQEAAQGVFFRKMVRVAKSFGALTVNPKRPIEAYYK